MKKAVQERDNDVTVQDGDEVPQEAQGALVPANAALEKVTKWFEPTSLAAAREMATVLAASDLVPQAYKGKPDNCIVAMIKGAELGLSPTQAIQNIAVINNRPSLWGDALPAIVKRAGGMIVEWFDNVDSQRDKDGRVTKAGGEDGITAFCKVMRPGHPDVIQNFSVAQAKQAGLWTKTGPWQQYKRRMLQMRARAFACRDQYPDALMGMGVAEEELDTPEQAERNAKVDVKALRTAPTTINVEAVVKPGEAPARREDDQRQQQQQQPQGQQNEQDQGGNAEHEQQGSQQPSAPASGPAATAAAAGGDIFGDERRGRR